MLYISRVCQKIPQEPSGGFGRGGNDQKHSSCVHVTDPNSAQPQRGECDLVRACGACSHPLDVSCRKTSILTPFRLISTETSKVHPCWIPVDLGNSAARDNSFPKYKIPTQEKVARTSTEWIFFSFSLLLCFLGNLNGGQGGLFSFLSFFFNYNILFLFRIKPPCSFPM